MEAMMGSMDIDLVSKHYRELCKLVPLRPISSERQYKVAVSRLNQLLDAGGADERSDLAGLVGTLGEFIHEYEARTSGLPETEPREVLRFLLDQHGLKQSDLGDIASQGTVSDILAGRRQISKAMAKNLAARFGVPVSALI
jgi:HTH-type transcriptional regulator / antitoxin HigA